MSPSPKTAEPLPDVRSYRTLKKLVRRYAPVKFEAAGAVFLYVTRIACDLYVSYLIGQSVGMLARHWKRGGALPGEFVDELTLLAVVMFARTALMYFSTLAAAAVAQKIENRLRSEHFAKVTTRTAAARRSRGVCATWRRRRSSSAKSRSATSTRSS
jgi:ABC-type multidrug transport system fused ATPase/permease subunit